MKKERIVITVEGGLIQDIQGIPKGLEVHVLDFDLNDSGDERVATCGDCPMGAKATHWHHVHQGGER